MRRLILISLFALPVLAGGCVAKTAFDIATMPVKAGAQAADWATTSQDEADRNYGREMRKREEAEGRERRAAEKKARRDRERAERDDDDGDD